MVGALDRVLVDPEHAHFKPKWGRGRESTCPASAPDTALSALLVLHPSQQYRSEHQARSRPEVLAHALRPHPAIAPVKSLPVREHALSLPPWAGGMTVALSGLSLFPPGGEVKANVVLIIVDQLAHWATDPAQRAPLDLPGLDSLAANGITFTHCYATSPVCSANRLALLSGHYPFSLGTNKLGAGVRTSAAPWPRRATAPGTSARGTSPPAAVPRAGTSIRPTARDGTSSPATKAPGTTTTPASRSDKMTRHRSRRLPGSPPGILPRRWASSEPRAASPSRWW